MAATAQSATGIFSAAGRLARSGLGAVHNRIELFSVEWEEERLRLMQALLWAAALLLLGALAVLLFTVIIVFLFPREARIYVVGAFMLLYLVASIVAGIGFKRVVRREAFPETLNQIKKDRAWLESLE